MIDINPAILKQQTKPLRLTEYPDLDVTLLDTGATDDGKTLLPPGLSDFLLRLT